MIYYLKLFSESRNCINTTVVYVLMFMLLNMLLNSLLMYMFMMSAGRLSTCLVCLSCLV